MLNGEVILQASDSSLTKKLHVESLWKRERMRERERERERERDEEFMCVKEKEKNGAHKSNPTAGD